MTWATIKTILLFSYFFKEKYLNQHKICDFLLFPEGGMDFVKKENCIGYELKGTAKYFKKGKYYSLVKEIPENKEEPCKGAILITINKIKKLA